MAGTSLSAQLLAIKTTLDVSGDPEPGRRRPLTRPSVLFDAKAAADIDLDTIFNNAISGLDVLISLDERFRKYSNDLFSHQSKEFDRELGNVEENSRINTTIASYLRLLSGYLECHSSFKTLEYLIRRYKAHVYNAEDLILCALPYHDTHAFVQIVQIIETKNSKWKFLDGSRASGASPPRNVIVQQCVRDMGVFDAICDYALSAKKFQLSKPVTGFCTAVIFDVLVLVKVDDNIVKKILPYVSFGLQPNTRGLDQKAGALMIVSLLSQKATMKPQVVNSLMRSVADLARFAAKEIGDSLWMRLSLMAIISIVQLQSVELIPKKTVQILNEIRDFPGILSGMIKEFNIDKFLVVFLQSLLEYRSSDEVCEGALLSMIEILPLSGYVNLIVSKLLHSHIKILKGKNNLDSTRQGCQDKEILVSLCEKYPSESYGAFSTFLKDTNIKQEKKVDMSYDKLCKILDETLKLSSEVWNPKILIALEHGEAVIRQSVIMSLNELDLLQDAMARSKKLDAIQEALLHRLYDEDINVVIAVLKLKNFPRILHSPLVFEALQHVLQRCIDILLSSSSKLSSYEDASLLCLEQVILCFKDQENYRSTLATIIFPLILIQPKTQRLNLKALELAKQLKWPFYENLANCPQTEKDLELGRIPAINMENIYGFSKIFSLSFDEYIPWIYKCCSSQESSKPLFFLILLQSAEMLNSAAGQVFQFFKHCFPVLKSEWEKLESEGISATQLSRRSMEWDCKKFLEHMSSTNIKDLNYRILVCLFLKLSRAVIAIASEDSSLDAEGSLVAMLQDLFFFFTSHSKDIFWNHMEDLVISCKIFLKEIIVKLLTEEDIPCTVQVERLSWLSHLCRRVEVLGSELLAEFPYLLVPLSSDNKDVRNASMSCTEELFAKFPNGRTNAKEELQFQFLGELLFLIIQQKKMILSDKSVLSSFFTSLLSSASHSVLVLPDSGKRFDVSTKKDILDFIVNSALKLSCPSKLKILMLLKGLGNKVICIEGVRFLLNNLLERYHFCLQNDNLNNQLSNSEVDLLCFLLESCTRSTSSSEAQDFVDPICKALELNGTGDATNVKPCLTVLRNLSSSLYGFMKIETQEHIFRSLLILLRNANGDIQNSTKETLLRINVNSSVVGQVLASILNQLAFSVGSSQGKRRKKAAQQQHSRCNGPTQSRETTLSFIRSFLDVLLMKKSIENRTALVEPLLKLLHMFFMNDELMFKVIEHDEANTFSSGVPQPFLDSRDFIQQTILMTLEDICVSLSSDLPQKDALPEFDLQLLVRCSRSSINAVTRNHIFLLITTIAKIVPDKVLDQVVDIITVMGESTVTQWDGFSKSVFEGLVSAIVPHWLSKSGDVEKLLQIFVNIMPQIVEHRRLSIIAHILRTLGEAAGLGSFLFLLFRSLISRNFLGLDVDEISLHSLTILISKQWEYELSVQLCELYSCNIWLPSIILALKKIESGDVDEKTFMEMLVAMQFVDNKLRDPEISYRFDAGEDLKSFQTIVGELMEQIVFHLQLIDSKKKRVGVRVIHKKELKEYVLGVLKTVSKGLLPSTFFNIIINLIRHTDEDVKKKALKLLCETAKENDTNNKHEKKSSVTNLRALWLQLDETSSKTFENLCFELLTILDYSEDVSNISLKISVASTFEVLASRFPSHDTVFTTCLGSICKRICLFSSSFSFHCLRATGALICALGPKALFHLPSVMESLLNQSHDMSSVTAKEKDVRDCASGSSNLTESLFISILLTLEAVINHLGSFLNPYIGDILRLIILHPLPYSTSELKLKLKIDVVRKLVTDKIPVRLLLSPILGMYPDAVNSGELCLSIYFEMLGHLIRSLDRSSINAYHTKIFDLCLLALDLRRQDTVSVKNIDIVEQNVISVVVTLTMKLTETMFRPLFIKTIEWSGLKSIEGEYSEERKIERAIAFFGLVDKLAESHRSLFVPFFKYLLDSCVLYLSDSEGLRAAPASKKRKTKISVRTIDSDDALFSKLWHLRALILFSLHKCFMYDTGSTKFLDSSNFQVLLKPIVLQLIMDPPSEYNPLVPSVKEVDDLLVSSIGQMAVTAGSDLLWKPLNHEVLMQTRSEKVRARILGLRIVKYFVEKLKEEYLVLLPETIPFLGELLEDSELPVKSLAQEIIKEMELLSGESLREYF